MFTSDGYSLSPTTEMSSNTTTNAPPIDMTISYETCCQDTYLQTVQSELIDSVAVRFFNETTHPVGHEKWILVDQFCNRTQERLHSCPASVIGKHMLQEMNFLHLPVYGYISPCLSLFTLITNVLVCVVLLQKHMRNPTNVLLVAMAISDLLTGFIPVPAFIYIYTLGNYKDWLTCDWAKLMRYLTLILPTICHTASIWLTVALAVQRYLCVCHSLKAKQWCTIRNIVISIVAIYVTAFLSQVSTFGEVKFQSIEMPSVVDPMKMVHGCVETTTEFIQKHENAYYQTYWWFRVMFIHMIPCGLLVILNAFLIMTMRAAQVRREQLLKQNRNSECRRLKETNSTTFMLVAVVGLFLLVECPMAIIFILYILHSSFYPNLLQSSIVFELASLIVNLCILLSYPINFFIYCGMSRQFRETFKRLFIPGSQPLTGEQSQYVSLATENGNKNGLTHETAC